MRRVVALLSFAGAGDLGKHLLFVSGSYCFVMRIKESLMLHR